MRIAFGSGSMPFVKVFSALAAAAALLTFVPGFAQVPGVKDYGAAKQDAELYGLGVRIAILLQRFDEPSSFEPRYATTFSEYGRAGTSYFYANPRFACKVDIGFNNILPALNGYTIEDIECCTQENPLVCKKYTNK
jgi:hypothetical protein